ncbi:hypothetical protein EPD60_09645 [Flaviaesturariibacter flavus]|uniref:Uncharacterized protein n=1 Tax=Flaviaesturariibacter flavus TaxID=2502780 RepID=A0A4R1BB80_9BACT|nr:hypothetical protein [Flaviaesturariibacter flavus]TCJ14256.1 hypothetical protein EPD60_09645 [Flaviaesturariibacter flavus]
MNESFQKVRDLLERVPRRHNADNVKEINSIVDEYEDVLRQLESNPQLEPVIAGYFEALDPIRRTIKESNHAKHSKKAKDDLFDDASGQLKDSMEDLLRLEASL